MRTSPYKSVQLRTSPYNTKQLQTPNIMTQILKNIRTVEIIESRLLSNITIVGQGVFLKYWRNFKKLPTSGLSEASVASSFENKSRIFTTKLTSHLTSHFDVADRHLCFLITAVDGSRYLIGTDERPYPTVNTEDVMPSRESDKSGCTLTVEYQDTIGLLKVLD